MGAWLAAFGRTLPVARIASVALSSLAAPLPYLALRSAGVARTTSLVATALALVTPWMLWSGATTVPESFTATATAAAIVALAARPSLPFAALLACACLSRYEAWPVAAVAAVVCVYRHRSFRVALVCVAAVIAWMLWNAYAHGSPIHFFHRVSTFKRAIGAGSTSTLDALLLYPRLLVTTRPEVVVASLAGMLVLRRDASLRARWLFPLGAAFAQLAFLAIGNARDGAPAHHPERALLGVLVIAALFAVDACLSLAPRIRTASVAVASVLWLVALRGFGDPPGRTPSEDRRAQVARGEELRARRATAIELTPCVYEHFAVIAAYGAPENVTVHPKMDAPVVADCPRVATR